MATSKLNTNFKYEEKNEIYPEDQEEGFDAFTYIVKLFGVHVRIALGNTRYNEDYNISYFPIYLIVNDEVDAQIGVYEVMNDILPNVLNEDGSLNIEMVGDPILFSFASKIIKALPEKINKENLELLLNLKLEQEQEQIASEEKEKEDEDEGEKEGEEEDEDEEEGDEKEKEGVEEEDEKEKEGVEEEDEKEKEGVEEEDEKEKEGVEEGEEEDDEIELMTFDLLPLQTLEDAIEEKTSFKKKRNSPWIQKFLHSSHYNIIDNEGGGDCLFATIRDGLARVGKRVTVREMREILAENATEDLFNNYVMHYTFAKDEYDQHEEEVRNIKVRLREIKAEHKNAKKQNIKANLASEARELANMQKQLKPVEIQKKELVEEFVFMEGVTTLEEFKKVLLTCKFWGETWAISTLERVLNVKLILFSHENYRENDKDNVLQCGQLNDNVLEERGVFEPEYYIMMDYTGNHYKLITYKDRGALTYAELPHAIKKKNSG